MACRRVFIASLAAAVALGGCAGQPKQPVLYPNNHLQAVGEQTAQQDIAACIEFARASNVNEKKDAEVGRKAAGGAAVGGASAAAWGLVRGGDVGNRALAGAAAGATAGAVHGGLQSTETSPLFMNFVNKCLSGLQCHRMAVAPGWSGCGRSGGLCLSLCLSRPCRPGKG